MENTQSVIQTIVLQLILDESANGSYTREMAFLSILRSMVNGQEYTERELAEVVFQTYFEDSIGRLELNLSETELADLVHFRDTHCEPIWEQWDLQLWLEQS